MSKLDRFHIYPDPGCGDTTEIAPDGLWVMASEALAEIAQRDKRIAELEAKLAKWPRVFWKSRDPGSLSKGFRVASVDIGKDGYVGVVVHAGGEEIYAPDDFGLYSTHEAALKGDTDE